MRVIKEIYKKDDITEELLQTIKVGDCIKINNWHRWMTVIARSKGYIIIYMTDKKYGYQYSILETKKRGYAHNTCYRPEAGFYEDEFVCGPDNYYGYYSYNIADECEDALRDLEKGKLEVSTRHGLGVYHMEIKRGKQTY